MAINSGQSRVQGEEMNEKPKGQFTVHFVGDEELPSPEEVLRLLGGRTGIECVDITRQYIVEGLGTLINGLAPGCDFVMAIVDRREGAMRVLGSIEPNEIVTVARLVADHFEAVTPAIIDKNGRPMQ